MGRFYAEHSAREKKEKLAVQAVNRYVKPGQILYQPILEQLLPLLTELA